MDNEKAGPGAQTPNRQDTARTVTARLGGVPQVVNLNGHAPTENLDAEPPTDAHPWVPIPVFDLFLPQPPTEYLVDEVMPRGTLGLVTGAAGVHKSNLLFDMAVCVATGREWLSRRDGTRGRSFPTIQAPVAWYNADNPTASLKKRFGAFLKGHEVTPADEIKLFPVSFPNPLLQLTDPEAVDLLRAFVIQHAIGLLIVDNLQLVKGGADENDASEMGPVIAELRRLIEATGVTIILIHHENKQGGYRGSSSIRDLIDWSIAVKREGHNDQITVRADKCRDAEIPSFGAAFWFRWKQGTKDLHLCRMHPWEPPDSEDKFRSWIIEILGRANKGAGLTGNQLDKFAKEDRISRDPMRDELDRLVDKGEVVQVEAGGQKGGGGWLYKLPGN